MFPSVILLVFGAVGILTGMLSAACSLIHLLRSIHRDYRVEEEQRILSLDCLLRRGVDLELGPDVDLAGAGTSPVQDEAI